jgi:hypothetical protein
MPVQVPFYTPHLPMHGGGGLTKLDESGSVVGGLSTLVASGLEGWEQGKQDKEAKQDRAIQRQRAAELHPLQKAVLEAQAAHAAAQAASEEARAEYLKKGGTKPILLVNKKTGAKQIMGPDGSVPSDWDPADVDYRYLGQDAKSLTPEEKADLTAGTGVKKATEKLTNVKADVLPGDSASKRNLQDAQAGVANANAAAIPQKTAADVGVKSAQAQGLLARAQSYAQQVGGQVAAKVRNWTNSLSTIDNLIAANTKEAATNPQVAAYVKQLQHHRDAIMASMGKEIGEAQPAQMTQYQPPSPMVAELMNVPQQTTTPDGLPTTPYGPRLRAPAATAPAAQPQRPTILTPGQTPGVMSPTGVMTPPTSMPQAQKKQLTTDIAIAYLKKANGDRAKAMQMASADGYAE